MQYSGVDKLPFTKVFRDPGSVDGIRGVETSSPVPRRKTPLPGTKQLTFPTGEHRFGIEGVHPHPEPRPDPAGILFGILAIACAVALIGLFWVANCPPRWGGDYSLMSRYAVKAATFALLGFGPVFTIMSRVLSDGKCRIGLFAPLVHLVGMLVSSAAISWLGGDL